MIDNRRVTHSGFITELCIRKMMGMMKHILYCIIYSLMMKNNLDKFVMMCIISSLLDMADM